MLHNRRNKFQRPGGGFMRSGGGFSASGGGFAGDGDVVPFVRARSAADVRRLLGATPGNLVTYDEASGDALDKVGTWTLTATGGATRVSSPGGKAGRADSNSTQYWGSGNVADGAVGAAAFAIVGVATILASPPGDQAIITRSQSGVGGYFVSVNNSNHLLITLYEPTARTAEISVAHTTGVRFGFVVGRSITDLKMYAASTFGSGEGLLAGAVNVPGSARVSAPGRHQVDAGAGNCTGCDLEAVAWFYGAEAERILSSRTSVVQEIL